MVVPAEGENKKDKKDKNVWVKTFCNRCYKPYEQYDGKLFKMCVCDESYKPRELRFREL